MTTERETTMTDDDLIARLRSQIGDDVQHVYDHEALFRLSADRIEALVKENIALKEHVADMLAEQECGCGYDKPTDVCLGHLPLYRKTEARAETAEDEVEKLREVERAARKLEENLGVEGVNVGSLRVDLYRALAALKGDDHE